MDSERDAARDAVASGTASDSNPPAEAAAATLPAGEPAAEARLDAPSPPQLPPAATLAATTAVPTPISAEEAKPTPPETICVAAPEAVASPPSIALAPPPARAAAAPSIPVTVAPEMPREAVPPPVPPPESQRPARAAAPPPAAAAKPSAFRREAPVVPPPSIARKEIPQKTGGAARSGRFALLAASIALAATFGGALGAAGFAGAAKLLAKPATVPVPRADASDEIKAEVKALRDGLAQQRGAVKGLNDNIAALRTSFDNAGKATNAQFAKVGDTVGKLTESVDRIERMQAEPAARLGKVIETLERLEKRAAAMATTPEPTGSVTPAQSRQPTGQPPQTLQQQQQQLAIAQPAAAQPHSLQAQPLQPPPAAEARNAQAPVIDDWIVRRVINGVAILEGRQGIAEVEVGDTLRGVGRVQEIRRQDGRWVVVTARGLIVPAR